MRSSIRAVLLLTLLASAPLAAHELRSVALRLEEGGAGQVTATLKTPLARDGRPSMVLPEFDAGCRSSGSSRAHRQGDTVLREWQLHCDGGLAGHRLRFRGLDPRTPDAVVTVRYADGREQSHALDRHDPQLRLEAVPPLPALFAYLPVGVEHILLGPDHLLFVLGLMLVVFAAGRGWKMLLAALTAFTLAHSLTLSLAVLGFWGLPARPVEIMIALSILLLAFELARNGQPRDSGNPAPSLTLPRMRGREWPLRAASRQYRLLTFSGELGSPCAAIHGSCRDHSFTLPRVRGREWGGGDLPEQERQQSSLTFRKPWLVAFVFGLLHGFGFAGALADIGLPEAARGWALLLFNLGVELGQILFVAAVLLLLAGLRQLRHGSDLARAQPAFVTLLGGVAAWWTLDRLALWLTQLPWSA